MGSRCQPLTLLPLSGPRCFSIWLLSFLLVFFFFSSSTVHRRTIYSWAITRFRPLQTHYYFRLESNWNLTSISSPIIRARAHQFTFLCCLVRSFQIACDIRVGIRHRGPCYLQKVIRIHSLLLFLLFTFAIAYFELRAAPRLEPFRVCQGPTFILIAFSELDIAIRAVFVWPDLRSRPLRMSV